MTDKHVAVAATAVDAASVTGMMLAEASSE